MNAALGPENPCDILARPRQGADEPRPQRIRQGDDDDGNRRRRLLGRPGCGSPRRDEHLDRQAHQLGRQGREPLFLPLGIAELQDEIAPFHIAEVAQALAEGLQICGIDALTTESTDPMYFRWRLCLGGKGYEEDAEDEEDEESDRGALHEGLLRVSRRKPVTQGVGRV
jgi:hypothetical protein